MHPDKDALESPIIQVQKHCLKFGEKFFEENKNGKITLINFGDDANKTTT